MDALSVVRSALIAQKVDGIDDSIVDYLGSVVTEEANGYTKASEIDEYTSQLFETLNPFLQDYGCAEATVHKVCEHIVKEMTSELKETEANSESVALRTVSVFRPVVLAELAAEEEAKSKKLNARAHGTAEESTGGNFNATKIQGAVEMDNRTRNRILKKERKAEERMAREKLSEEYLRSLTDIEVVVTHRDENDTSRWGGDIHIHNAGVSVAGKTLIDNCSLFLQRGRRYGLVGRNGMGKTTLLRHLSARELVGIPENLQIIHVEQEVHGGEKPVLEVVLGTDVERTALLEEEADIMAGRGDSERLGAIHTRLNEIDAYTAPARASALLSGLGFSPAMQQMPTKQFSGGWRMRVSLAQALFVMPDMLLLDEPTNHLDLPSTLWLENYLQNESSHMVVIIVSHDREFLNNIITDVIYLHQRQLVPYKGNYDTFEEVRSQRLIHQRAQNESIEKRRKHVQQFIDRFRYNANRAALVQSRIKSLERMQKVEDIISDPDIVFNFPAPEKLSPPIIQAIDITFGYTPERLLFQNVSFSLGMDSRIAVVGPNGAGKSTLIKLLCGQITPANGYVTRAGKLRLALFTQHHTDQLDLSLNAVDQIIQKYPGSLVADVRSHLGQFGVNGDMQIQSLKTLSGGQKSRVALAVLCFAKPHFLVLDEPTNHLDIDTVAALVQALTVFEGGVLVVSHDQHLIHGIADELWIVAGDGKIELFRGDFEEYKKRYAVQL
eukprot:c8999_g1_i1.p1 GENE.c8999_g1_i1~~c8999_g1_i1.p1  ORF type:complete len:724 (-),score=195.66 c8999_g1_i1:1799-3970(-)